MLIKFNSNLNPYISSDLFIFSSKINYFHKSRLYNNLALIKLKSAIYIKNFIVLNKLLNLY